MGTPLLEQIESLRGRHRRADVGARAREERFDEREPLGIVVRGEHTHAIEARETSLRIGGDYARGHT